MATLEQLVDAGIKTAEHFLLKKRVPMLQAQYTLITKDNELIILPVFFRNDHEKDVAVAAVKATAALTGAVQLLYVSEGWMLQLPKPLTPWHAERQMKNLPRASESPDRIEVVQSIATDGKRTIARSLQMVRDKPGGKLMALVRLGELETENGTNYIGRMIDGIIPVRKEEER
jgi:hypothetical protein